MTAETVARRPQTIPPGEPDAEQRRHVVTALVVDRPGTLNRVSGLLRARSFNIESLTVGATHVPGESRMTIVVRGDEGHLRQVLAQLERLIEVLEVGDLHAAPHVELELALAEVAAPASPADEQGLDAVLATAGGEWIERRSDSWSARLVAAPPAIDQAIEELRGIGLRSLVRAGSVALAVTREPTHPRNGASRE